ncbi:MAG: DUF927 domain-containing protein [Mesorhizobium sp.]|uniref:DUF927 domain-containing protein n=1 Tax=Mesorhizobium sp. TaxID=1871066 RepID=UPI000FE525C8|nr:DUF927 domain-containing protein [Mesorhizobium sp.]RWH69495.1 MAG: DUF927 domain-containing protein [Mesorhizobium sp.]RWH76361.1 MAG: DUF927 domain-containing protein [Mesorhizobium sp.]RWH83509.1 MAG: DUF927 domain-containing protein [Mesorhizobium sp.]RWH91526.1 MAG: DUF927 domain-containing protein [Mesorhizobium sp.]RWH95799.1 MAG: DUF927 domain-containing protein [Mesorhizobium sp.]
MNARAPEVHRAQAHDILSPNFETVSDCREYRRRALAAAPTTKQYIAEKCTNKQRCNSGLCPLCIRSLRVRFVEFLHQEQLHERQWFFVTAYIRGWTKKPGDLRTFGKLAAHPAIKAFVQRLRRLNTPNLMLIGAIETVWRTNDNVPTGKPFHLHFMISGPSEAQIKRSAGGFDRDRSVLRALRVEAVKPGWEDFRDAATYTVKQSFWKYSYFGLGPEKRRQFPSRRELSELICNLGPHLVSGRLVFVGIRYEHRRFRLTTDLKSVTPTSQVDDGSNNPTDAEKRPPNKLWLNVIDALVATLRDENWSPQPRTKHQSTISSAQPVPPCMGLANSIIEGKSIVNAQGTPRDIPVKAASPNHQDISKPRRFLELRHVEIHEPDEEYFFSLKFSRRMGVGEVVLPRATFSNAGHAKAALLKRGALLPNNFKERCDAILDDSTAPEIRVVRQGGWIGDAFICPFGVFGNACHTDKVKLNPSLTIERSVSGTKREFLRGIRPLLLRSDHLVLGYLAALLPSMASRLGRSESFGLNLAGDSSTGKTTALVLAQSLLTKTSERSLFNFNTAQATLTNKLTSYGGLAIPFADLKAASEKGPKVVEKIQTTVFNAVTGKGRENPTSSGLRAASFCVPLLSSEKPMSELFGQGSLEYQDGDAVRLIDVPVPKREVGGIYNRSRLGESSSDLAVALQSLLERQHGTIFPAWIECLSSIRLVALQFSVAARRFIFMQSIHATDGAHLRIAEHFALLDAAGDIASSAGLIPLKHVTIRKALVRLFNSAIGQFVASSKRDEKALDRFYKAIDSFPLATRGKALDGALGAVDGFRRKEEDGYRLYVKSEALRKVIDNDWCFEHVVMKHIIQLDALEEGSNARSIHVKHKGLLRARYLSIQIDKLDR